MKQFLLLLNRTTARILARNTATFCRRLSRDCFGDVLHNIFGKERLDDDHCTNSSRAHGLGYTWIHSKSPPKDRGRIVLQAKVNENAPLATLLQKDPKKKPDIEGACETGFSTKFQNSQFAKRIIQTRHQITLQTSLAKMHNCQKPKILYPLYSTRNQLHMKHYSFQ